MSAKFRKKATDLKKELAREIRTLEHELAEKKQLLSTLSQFESRKRPSIARPRSIARPAPRRRVKVSRPSAGRKTTRVRRPSKNRDTILTAAKRLKGRFTLAELKDKIFQNDPKFGGKYPSGTILALLRNTPEIKKLKRGVYRFKG